MADRLTFAEDLPPETIERMHRCWGEAFVQGAGPDTPAEPAAEAFVAYACALMANVSGRRLVSRALFLMAEQVAARADLEEAEAKAASAHRIAHH